MNARLKECKMLLRLAHENAVNEDLRVPSCRLIKFSIGYVSDAVADVNQTVDILNFHV